MKQFEIDALAEKIKNMDHETMCRHWRFSSCGSLYFRTDLITSTGESLGTLFSERLFKHFGGFTPELSKKIGW